MKITVALCLCPLLLPGYAGGAAAASFPETSSPETLPPSSPPAALRMAAAARTLLTSLSDEQRALATRPLDDPKRTHWHYVPKEDRKGLSLLEMTLPQRAYARELLLASLSPEGFHKAATVMQLEEVIRHFEPSNPLRDPLRYYFTVFGSPDDAGRWGLSVEGHHLSLNFLVDAQRIVSVTPLFIGANPAEVRDTTSGGPPPGTRPLLREEELARKLVHLLSPEQRRRAVVAEESPADMREGHQAQTSTTEPVGLRASEFRPDQRAVLTSLLETVACTLPADVAQAQLDLLRKELDSITFAWFGSTDPGQPHSVRILGPDVLILFYKAQADSAGNPANHTHVLWRTPGRDFGAGPEPDDHPAPVKTQAPGPPAAPVVLLPVGVTTSRSPRVEWHGDPHQQFQVLITDGPDATSPKRWDSGEVASSRDHLAATADLPTSTTLYAHVRLQNTHGWGPWSSARAAVFRVEPLPTPPGILHHFSLAYTRDLPPARAWEDLHLAVALQGIVNRDQPRLWLDYVRAEKSEQNVDAYWLGRLREPKAWLSGKSLTPVPDLSALVAVYRDRVRGLVVWDPEVASTALVASTIAGADDLLPVRFDPSPESLYSRLTSGEAALPVAVNLVGKFPGHGIIPGTNRTSTGSRKCDAYLWAVHHYLKTGRCDPRSMGYYIDAYWIDHANLSSLIQNHTLTNHDYFIARRGFFWDLSPWDDETPVDDTSQTLGTDLSTLKEILQAANDQLGGRDLIHVAGFTPWLFKYTDATGARGSHDAVQTEWETARILSAYNCYLDADALELSALANASAMMHMPLPRRYAQPPAPTAADLTAAGLLDDQGVPAPRNYLLHYVGDYDAAAWVGNSLFSIWDAPERGTVTLPWALNPSLSHRIRPFFEYAYRTRTARDHFIAGDSGAGYVNPSQLLPPRDPSGLPGAGEAWQRHCRRYFQAFDYTFTGFLINGRAGVIPPEVEKLYLAFSPNGVVNQHDLNHAPLHLEEKRLPAFVMAGDLSGDLATDLALVHANAETTPPHQARFLVFRSILQPISYLAQLNTRLTAGRPDLRYTFCDPKTFAYLARVHLGGDNADIVTYLFDTAPDELEPGREIEFQVALRNDGWDTWRSGDGADTTQTHRLGLSLSPTEDAPGELAWFPLPRDVPPGDTVVLPVHVKAPQSPGDQYLFLEMARGQTRFSSRGGSPSISRLTVRPPAPAPHELRPAPPGSSK